MHLKVSVVEVKGRQYTAVHKVHTIDIRISQYTTFYISAELISALVSHDRGQGSNPAEGGPVTQL